MVALLTVAWAADLPLPPSVSDAEAPVLEWRPVVQAQALALWSHDQLYNLGVGGRVGIEANRRALTARVSMGARLYPWLDGGITNAVPPVDSTAELSEAWIGLDPYISEALVIHLAAGLQPVEFNEGRLVGRQDQWLSASFPLAARLHLGAAPWSIDAVAGYREGGDVWAYPWWAVRAGAGRERPSGSWQVDVLATDVDLDVVTAPGVPVDDDIAAAGVYARVDVSRLRTRADAYVQPFREGGVAAMGGARLGWALGGDSRVVLGGAVEGGTGEEDGSGRFLNPWGNVEAAVGANARYPLGMSVFVPGTVGVGAFADMVVTPGLRVDAAAWNYHFADLDPYGAELDGDARLFFGPFAWLRFRGSLFLPWDSPGTVYSSAALSLDVQI